MATIIGTNAKNKLVSLAASDTLLGLGANDILLGNGGNDTIRGGTGNDIIDGGTGNDKLFGEAGNDKIKGGAGLDTIDGGAGNDTADGGLGNDTVKGGSGNDTLTGGAGNDLISGGTGTDIAVFGGLSTASVINQIGSILFISGANGIDRVLSDVESVKFSNGTFSAVAKTVTLSAVVGADVAPKTTGSLRNDTYIGSLDTNNSSLTTFNTGDALDGGASSGDKLSLALSGTAALGLGGTQLANVEIVEVQNTGVNAGVTFNAAQWTGVASIVLNSSLAGSNTLFTNLVNIVSATMQGGNAGNLSIGYGAGVLGGANDVQSLTLAGNNAETSQGSLFSVTGGVGEVAETLNIASNAGTVFRNSVTINDTNAHQTINITGTHHLDLDLDNATSVTTIDASGYGDAGDELLIFNIGVSDVTITGSGFNDEFVFSSDSLTSADTIGGGAGTDTVGFTDSTTLVDADLAGVTSIERLLVGSAGPLVTLTATLGSNASTGGIHTVDVFENASVDLAVSNTYAGPLTVNLDPLQLGSGNTNGNDTVNATTMSGALTVNALGGHIGLSDTLTAGAGLTDVLNLVADSGSANLSNVSRFDIVNVLAGTPATNGLSIVTAQGTVAAGALLTVNASALGAAASFVFNGAAETDGRFKVTGGSGSDELLGGSGNDELIGSLGADFLDGGHGDDILTGGGGNDLFDAGVGVVVNYGQETVSGGDGDDVIAIDGEELTNDDIIAGGANTDTLLITDGNHVNDGDFVQVTTMDVLSSAGTALGFADTNLIATLDVSVLNSGIRTLTSASGVFDDQIAINAGFTAALTINIGAGVDEVLTTGTNADITINAKEGDISALDVLQGGLNFGDVLNLSADAGNADLTGVTDFETINVTGAANAMLLFGAGTIEIGGAVTVNAASLDGGLTVNATSVGSGRNLAVNGGSSGDVMNAGAGDDTYNGNGGDDTFHMGSNLTFADTISGGAGTGDRITVTSDLNDTNFTLVSNVEILELLTGGLSIVLGAEANNLGNGVKTVLGTSGNDNITIAPAFGVAQAIAISILGGVDTVDAQAGGHGIANTNVTVNADEGDFTSADFLQGGGDLGDVLNLTASAGGADLSTTRDFETINVLASGGNSVYLLLDSNTVETDVRVTINASGLGAAAGLTVDAGLLMVDEDLTVNGGAGDDSFYVGAGDDILSGGGGEDLLRGNEGIDSLTGGDSNDTLLGGAGNDSLLDGGNGDDSISGGLGNDTIVAGAGADTIVVVGNGTLAGLGTLLNTADANGLDTITLTADSDIDRVVFDLDIAANSVSVISGFDAAVEDLFVVETGSSGWAASGEVRQSGSAVAQARLVVLDNTPGGFSGISDATNAADVLQTDSASGTSYVIVWADTGGVVHVSYATVDASGDAQPDNSNDLAKLSGVSLANIDLSDFSFI